MHVQVGPLSSSGALVWIAYARTVLAQAMTGQAPGGVHLDPDVVEAFEGFLEEWEQEAKGGGPFLWVGEIDPERVEFLAHAFSNVATALAADADERGFPVGPPEGEDFYQAVVIGFLDALSLEGGAIGAYAVELRANWPGLPQE